MGKGRIEAFSDGVIAVIITIMVLDMKVPHGADLGAIQPVLPVFLTYLLSFVFISIYWNNHHHMLYTAQRIDGLTMWANLHLLFWLSLVPFVTGWMGENHFAALPTALYGVVLLMAAVAYTLLQAAIVLANGKDSTLATAVGSDLKGKVSLVCYVAGIAAAFFSRWTADVLYVAVAIMWLIPDRRIEKVVAR
ncbi:MAG: DUF1211 domain-containing protein [Candidatus Eremiobacteraeota bacterium]|nr:DUF1211 domain-containing protein [Candidatus Eremiobacteraeota bacterium]MBC5826184.1 DUF1211 domain-containing protein [Candidatus Eremiobacteraeota bacterium]